MALLLFVTSIIGCAQKTVPSSSQEVAKEAKSILVYSGAGLSKPMTEIGKVFESKTGIKVNYNFAGSAQLLSQMELSKEGDVFIPGDLVDMDKAKEKGFATDYKKVVYHIPVIGVPKGNPAQIAELSDLAKPGVKLVIGDEKSCAIGKLAVNIFKKNNLWPAVEKNIVAKDATVNEVVTHTAMKQADASIITEDNGINSKDIEMIAIPESQNLIETVPVGALTFSKQAEAAKQFVEFVASAEGKAIFKNMGFKPVE